MTRDKIVTPRMLWVGAKPEATHSAWQNVEAIATGEQALERAAESPADVIVLSCPVSDFAAGDLLEQLQRLCPGALILIWDPAASVADAVRYMRLGAHDVAAAGDDILAIADAAVELRRGQMDASCDGQEEPWRRLLIGSSQALQRTIEVIRLVGGRRSTVLITGETGTGKEVVARAVHMASPRAHLPLVAVNCNALPESLLEAELFGHVKGAFTGAIQHRMGRFEQAHRSTLFLDEVGDLPLEMQTKLLRVLQEREFQRVGSSETVRVDVRLIAATNVNLLERIRQGKFREDLYYRLNVVPISTPPLRDRPEDIPPLAQHFVEKICRLEDIPAPRLSAEALSRLKSYTWPGNVRQLENIVEMAVAMGGGRPVLHPSDFPLPGESVRPKARAVSVPEGGLDFDRTVGDLERQIIVEALRMANGNKTAAAGMLGLKRTTLAAKLKSLEASA